ncbi:MAG: hypothetical protein OEY19_11690 [Gammaproteobacteria bacterium]|nr:hypothetical protein [Gammaproteobacteria bacterium]MDH5629189.1 hypothetical protein [Gammaproteobacteria bacterium]
MSIMEYSLEHCLEMTHKLLSLTHQNQWEEMQEIAAHRHKAFELYFAQSPLPDDHELVHSIVNQIMETDEKIRLEMAQYRQDAIDDGVKLNSANNAVNQYQTVKHG